MKNAEILEYAKTIDKFANSIREYDCAYDGWEIFSFHQEKNGELLTRFEGEPCFILRKGKSLKFVSGDEGFNVLRVIIQNEKEDTN